MFDPTRILGPLLPFELTAIARRGRYVVMRLLYVLALLAIVWTAAAATEFRVRRGLTGALKGSADFAENFFCVFSILQVTAGIALGAVFACGTVSVIRRNRTIEHLFATDLTSAELVFGKFFSRLLMVVWLLFAATPVLFCCQLFGALPIESLIQSTIVAVTSTVMSAAAATMISVWTVQPRNAFLRTFGLFLFYFGMVMGLIGLKVYRPDLYVWVYPFHQEAMVANPYLTPVYSAFNRSPTTAFPAFLLGVRPGWNLVGDQVWNQLVASACMLGLAIWRIRPAHLKAVDRPAKPAARTPSRILGRFRPSLDVLPAMIWREVFVEAFVRSPGRWGKPVAAVLVLILAGTVGYLYVRSMADEYPYRISGYLEVVRFGTSALACVYVLMAALRASSSISGERESNTIETLTSTCLTGREIVLGKLLGASLGVRIILWMIAALWISAISLAPQEWWRAATMAPALLVATATAAGLGVWNSLRASTSTKANVQTIIVLLVVGGGYMLPLLFLMDQARIPFRGNAQFVMAPAGIWMLIWPVVAESNPYYENVREAYATQVKVFLLSLALHAAAATVLWGMSIVYFDRLVGRNSGRQPKTEPNVKGTASVRATAALPAAS